MNESLKLMRETQAMLLVAAGKGVPGVSDSAAEQPNKPSRSQNSGLSTNIVPMSHIHVAREMYTLSLLYFPDLKPYAFEFLQASMLLPMGVDELKKAAVNSEVYTRFHAAQKAFDDQISEYALRYLS